MYGRLGHSVQEAAMAVLLGAIGVQTIHLKMAHAYHRDLGKVSTKFATCTHARKRALNPPPTLTKTIVSRIMMSNMM